MARRVTDESATTTMRIRPTREKKAALMSKADEHGKSYREYVVAIIKKGVEQNICFDPPSSPDLSETRLGFDLRTKKSIHSLAKLSGMSPEEWALRVLDRDDEILGG
jgi:hypothetical protein